MLYSRYMWGKDEIILITANSGDIIFNKYEFNFI